LDKGNKSLETTFLHTKKAKTYIPVVSSKNISPSLQLLFLPTRCTLAIAALIISIMVLVVFLAIGGFLIQLLAQAIAAITILVIAIAGGSLLYLKYRS
jgi:hypothetical protein